MIRHATVLLIFLSQCSFAQQASGIEELSIEQAINVAAERNHDLRLSAIAVSNAKAVSRVASAAPHPTLTVQTFNINFAAGIGAGIKE